MPVKPPHKGDGLTQFRVGNHGESLLNVWRAVEAFQPNKKKAAPRKLPFHIDDESGQARTTPSNLANNFCQVVKAMDRLKIDVLAVDDPLRTDFTFTFRRLTEKPKGVPEIQYERLRIDGTAAWLKNHPKLILLFNSNKVAGCIESQHVIPDDLAYNGITSNPGYPNATFSSRDLKENEICPCDLRTYSEVEKITAQLVTPESYMDIITLSEGKRGQPVGRIWRLDAPIKVERQVGVADISFTDPHQAPRLLATKKPKDGSIKTAYAIITGPNYQLEPTGSPEIAPSFP